MAIIDWLFFSWEMVSVCFSLFTKWFSGSFCLFFLPALGIEMLPYPQLPYVQQWVLDDATDTQPWLRMRGGRSLPRSPSGLSYYAIDNPYLQGRLGDVVFQLASMPVVLLLRKKERMGIGHSTSIPALFLCPVQLSPDTFGDKLIDFTEGWDQKRYLQHSFW